MRISHEKFFGATPNFLGNFAIGGVAGLFMVPFSVPEERIKCMLQKTEKHGVREIYRGTFATILRDFFGCGLYLAVYESIKWLLMDRNDYENGKLSPPSIFWQEVSLEWFLGPQQFLSMWSNHEFKLHQI
uniref:Uncharacterized protein n=1 Tax=Ditylenchus dipsaci TaxID=166011 RepID=A0A915D409_9BILA